MKANQIYASFLWMINEGIMSDYQFRQHMTTLENRLKEHGVFVGGLSDVQIIDKIINLN